MNLKLKAALLDQRGPHPGFAHPVSSTGQALLPCEGAREKAIVVEQFAFSRRRWEKVPKGDEGPWTQPQLLPALLLRRQYSQQFTQRLRLQFADVVGQAVGEFGGQGIEA